MKLPVIYGNGGAPAEWSQTIAVSAPLGSTITVSGGGESFTASGTGAGTYYAFNVHEKSTVYTISATIDGITSPSQTVTTGTSAGAISFVDIAFGTINLTYDDDFRGVSISCVNGGTAITKTAPAVGNAMTFYPPNTGTWTISATISGDTYTTTAEVTSLSTPVSAELITVPDGSTVLPTDDIQIWLACANINKPYTTLAEVLADTDTLQVLISNNNAVDYMVRSTTWATDVCADENAMRYIGKRNYAANTLLNNEDWALAIIKSTYSDSVLDVSVPTMTSNNTPEGQVIYSTVYSASYPAWKAFTETGEWGPSMSDTVNNCYIGYQFTSAKRITEMYLRNTYSAGFGYTLDIEASNTGNAGDWVKIKTDVEIDCTKDKAVRIANNNSYSYYRIVITSIIPSGTSINIVSVERLNFLDHTDANEANIDIYSAANDTITITPQGGGASLTVVTDSAGHGTIARSNIAAGEYTFTSSVAKDPDNVLNDYSENISIISTQIEVSLMPNGNILYWYGYKGEAEAYISANGWSLSGYTLVAPTENTNYLAVYSGSYQGCAYGSISKVDVSEIHCIADFKTGYDGQYGNLRLFSAKDFTTADVYAITTSGLQAVDYSPTPQTNYVAYQNGAENNSRLTWLYALWYE